MRRLPWRWVLPVLQVLLAIALVTWGRAQQREHDANLRAMAHNPSKEEAGWGPVVTWGYKPPAYQLCIGVNFTAALIVAPVFLLTREKELPRHSRFALLVPVALVWYWFGLAIDRRFGSLPPARPRLPRLARLFLLSVASTLFAGLTLYLLLVHWYHWPMVYLLSVLWSIGLLDYFATRLVSLLRAQRPSIS